MVGMGLKLSEQQADFLDGIAKEKQVSRGAVIRWAIDAYRKSLFLPEWSTDSPNGCTVDRFEPARARREHPVTIRETQAEYNT